MKIRIPAFLFLLLLIYPGSYGQDMVFQINNYTTKDYGRDFHPSNMAVVQDSRGLIYTANGFKLLEFDGKRWNSYPINKEAWILSLAVDSNGIIYAGSQSEFGYFAPVKSGMLKYTSLSDSLNNEDLDFSNVWKVHVLSGDVIFQSEERIFIYRKGKIKVIKPSTSFHTSFVINGKLYIRQREEGLMVLEDDKVKRINGSQVFNNTGIFLMVPFGKEMILAGTRDKGFFLFDQNRENPQFRQYVFKDNKIINESVITGGTPAYGGSVAIGTMMNGIFLVDTTGATKAVINTSTGLGDNEVKQLITDKAGDIWAALNNGLSRIAISSPLSVYNEMSGIPGQVSSVIRFKGSLFAGTSSGLMVQNNVRYSSSPFITVSGITSPVRSICEAYGNMYVGTDDGLYVYDNERIKKLSHEAVFTLYFLSVNNMLFSGGPSGMKAYKFRNDTLIPVLKSEGEDIVGITGNRVVEDNVCDLWLGTRYDGAIRIKIKDDAILSSDHFALSDGLPEGPVIPSVVKNEIIFLTIRGLFTFADENEVKRSLPDSLKNKSEFVRGYFTILNERYILPGESVSLMTENNGKIWICSDNNVGWFDKNDDLKYISRPFKAIDAGKINSLYPEDNEVCWIGTSDGLIRFDGSRKVDYDRSYLSLIRKVTLMENDSALFYGAGSNYKDGIQTVSVNQGSEQLPVLKFENNSIRFDFAAASYDDPDKIQYSYRLGKNPRWSQWSSDNYQELTNLREGDYSFLLKAKTVFGTESVPAEYRFSVLPPWYRSLPAYIGYVILSFIILLVSARIYSWRLKKENIRLEGIITERTAEIVRQKDEIVNKNVILEHQKKEIEDSIRYASRIQTAVIPSEKSCREIIPETFIFFRPLNIVSGDFYWISRVGKKIIYTAADCTGHGVPGAFMSMLGVAFLNEIVNKDNIISPEKILNNLRLKVIHALQQQGISGETRDGMDMVIVSIDTEAGTLEYSGSYNPLIMVRNGEITEFPGEKMPVGYYENMRDFSKQEIKFIHDDMFYMYSDGYEDQFGGADGKKYKSRRLKNLLIEISGLPVEKQKEILGIRFEEWKGDHPQIDDVVLVGIRINKNIIA